jgi:aminopeptidase N
MQRLEKILLSGFLFWSGMLFGQDETVMLGEVDVVQDSILKAATYNSSSRTVDVLHMDLELSLDWGRHALLGQADLYVKPYFYDLDSVTLDAKGFTWHKVALVKGGLKHDVAYRYDGMQIHIALDRNYARNETIHLYLDYTALPDSLEIEGGSAISDAKGFYFIDSSATRMQQFWTQGEPESNSAWFPTVDKPYEKITHRIGLTVDSTWQTLSNGKLEFRTQNGDGTRTDYWLMDQPHTPYLVMLAGGKFDTVGTRWNGIPVRYFVEPEWADDAERIFGVTPAMMTFFSDILGVAYPWTKYDQIVVRDYVSGAMENTTATVHGDFLYTDKRAFADDPNEDIIAHELFHQWFGDLVTCESWGQLPLNESFATYGEVLWKNWKYGPDAAEWHAYNDLRNYLREFNYGKAVKMIRPDFEDPLEMFDSHSYAKGGRILRMLHRTVGNDAFFASLNKYLVDNAYQAAEISDLRKAFEQTTGRDLQWFFDQWFHEAGHPQLKVDYTFDKSTWTATVNVEQTQDLSRFPVYRLPVTIAVYTRKEVLEFPVEVNAQKQSFSFELPREPRHIKFDADNYLLAEYTIEQNDAHWLSQLGNSEQAFDRYLAAKELLETSNPNLLTTVAGIAMDDKFWTVRLLGLKSAEDWDAVGRKKLESTVKKLLDDEHPQVRAEAIYVWSAIYEKKDEALYRENLNFISYEVNGAALAALARVNSLAALTFAMDSTREDKGSWAEYCMPVIAEFGNKQQLQEADTLMVSRGGYAALYWYYYLGTNFDRGGQEGEFIVDLMVSRAKDSESKSLQYYAYRFLLENTEELEAELETASPEAAKELKPIARYARQKLDELKDSK